MLTLDWIPATVADVEKALAWRAQTDHDAEPIICVCCETEFRPPTLCFYNLCNICFEAFNDQKMCGRFGMVFRGKRETYFEFADKWVEANNCICKCKEGLR